MDRADLKRKLDSVSAQLMEHCSAVQIFVVVTDPVEQTSEGFATGSGCFYSRLGYVRDWLITQDERVREFERNDDEEKEEL